MAEVQNNQISRIQKSQREIRSGKALFDCDDYTLKYAQRPIGQALRRGRPRMADEEKGQPNDRVICDLCGGKFTRSNRSSHKKTEKHKLYEKVNKKMAKLIFDD